jgi:serine/threonine protein kinase HipA of HipAB toxin-antitoxin module
MIGYDGHGSMDDYYYYDDAEYYEYMAMELEMAFMFVEEMAEMLGSEELHDDFNLMFELFDVDKSNELEASEIA